MPPALGKKQPKEPVGPAVGTIIILILLVIGAIYFWRERQAAQPASTIYIPADASTTTAQ